MPIITYEKQKVKEQRLNFSSFASWDCKSFDSPIGGITNVASNLYAMLPNFEKDTMEYQEISKRIKLTRRFQGDAIDKTKGISYSPPPKKWSHRQKYLQIPENATEKEIEEINKANEQIKFDNSICCNKKSYFFGYIYPQKMTEYRTHKKTYDRNCRVMFGMGINDLIKVSEKTPAQKRFLRDYYKYSPLFNSKCSMNILSKYIEDIDFTYKYRKKRNTFDYSTLMSCNVEDLDLRLARKVQKIAKKYSRLHQNITTNLKIACKYLEREEYEDLRKTMFDSLYEDFQTDILAIINNLDDCLNYLVYVCYAIDLTCQKSLIWYCFGDEIVRNVRNHSNHRYQVVKNQNGKDYFGQKYTIIDNYRSD